MSLLMEVPQSKSNVTDGMYTPANPQEFLRFELERLRAVQMQRSPGNRKQHMAYPKRSRADGYEPLDAKVLPHLKRIQVRQSQICEILREAISQQEYRTHTPVERVFWSKKGAMKKLRSLERRLHRAKLYIQNNCRATPEQLHVFRMLEHVLYLCEIAEDTLNAIRADYNGHQDSRQGYEDVFTELYGDDDEDLEAVLAQENQNEDPRAFMNRYMVYARGFLQEGMRCLGPILQAEDSQNEGSSHL